MEEEKDIESQNLGFQNFQIEGKQNHNLDSFDDISREQI